MANSHESIPLMFPNLSILQMEILFSKIRQIWLDKKSCCSNIKNPNWIFTLKESLFLLLKQKRKLYNPPYCLHWFMQMSCMLMLLPLNHWMLSTTVPFDSLHKIAITLTTVGYMQRLHGHHWHLSTRHQHTCVIYKALLSKLPRYLTSLVEFTTNYMTPDHWIG